MNDLIIRKANINDLKAIQELSQLLIEYEHKKLNNKYINLSWSLNDDGKKNFLDLINNHFVYIAEYKNKCIGYACGEILKKRPWHTVQFAELINIYVKDDFRNLKIGSKFINIFKQYCRNHNVKHIQICTLSSNLNSINFYKKNNFRHYIDILLFEDE